MRLFGLIRDPRDAIASQFELWGPLVPDDSPRRRERQWLDNYRHLAELRERLYVPIFRYEDLSSAPSCYVPMLFHFCGLREIPSTYDHLKPTSVGRYWYSLNPAIRRWKMSPSFQQHLREFGYTEIEFLERVSLFLSTLPKNIRRQLGTVKRTLDIGVSD